MSQKAKLPQMVSNFGVVERLNVIELRLATLEKLLQTKFKISEKEMIILGQKERQAQVLSMFKKDAGVELDSKNTITLVHRGN